MHEFYENPLCGRYADEEMKRQFSDDNKFSTWRRLWLALAESEQELGLNISDEQLEEMRAHIDDIDYAAAAAHEHEVRHDVMAHVLTFGECCPKAKPIITSARRAATSATIRTSSVCAAGCSSSASSL